VRLATANTLRTDRNDRACCRQGDTELVGAAQIYVSPKVHPATNLNLQVPAFSFSAWVELDQTFTSGYIVRKSPSAGTRSSVCWGWYLHADKGPALHYGAHDSPPPAFGEENVLQVAVAPDQKLPLQHSQNHLMTIVVEAASVTFFKDREQVGTSPLQRSVTDCHNDHGGILVGSPGLKLRQLRFYAAGLQPVQVSEMYRYGKRLSSISTGSDAYSKKEHEGQTAWSDLVMQQSIAGLEAKMMQQLRQSEATMGKIAAIHKAASDDDSDAASFASAAFAKGHTPAHSFQGTHGGAAIHNTSIDQQAGGKHFYSLIPGQVRLTATSDGDARYLTHVPSFNNTGATVSYWYRHTPSPSGLFLFWAFDDDQAVCWSLWVEDGAIWYDNPKGRTRKFEYLYFKDLGVSELQYLRGDKVWRHVALQFDETSDELRLYIDGTLLLATSWDSPIRYALKSS